MIKTVKMISFSKQKDEYLISFNKHSSIFDKKQFTFSTRSSSLSEEIISNYKPELDKNVFNEIEFEKLKELKEYDNELNYAIRKSDIDINNHVHNLNYIDMAHEILNEEKVYDNIRISYKKEIKYGDKIKVIVKVKDQKYYFTIKNIESGIVNAIIEMYQGLYEPKNGT